MGEFEVCELGRLEEVLDLGRFINKVSFRALSASSTGFKTNITDPRAY